MNEEEDQPDAPDAPDEIPQSEDVDIAQADTTETGQAPGDEYESPDQQSDLSVKVTILESEVRDLKQVNADLVQRITELNQREANQEHDEIAQIQEKAELHHTLDQLQSQIDALTTKTQPQATDFNSPNFPVLLGGRTTVAANTWDEKDVNGGALVTIADTLKRSASADSLSSALKNLAGTDFVAIEREDHNSGTLCKRFIVIARGAECIGVHLTQTGGSAGSSSAYCSYTYTVKDVSDTITFGTSIAPLFARPFKAECLTAASKGVAYIHTDGTIKLLACDEVFKTTVC